MPPRPETDKLDSGYLPLYLERVSHPKRILEVGVLNGGSLVLWCELWASVERVVGIDIAPPLEGLHPRVVVVQADQSDRGALQAVAAEFGPFDLIIDDASHCGAPSWTTFEALWGHVVPGGLYVVEDWGTGYWSHWPDGLDYHPGPPPGHTAGMVGMVKRLVDEVQHSNVAKLEIMPCISFVHKAG